jgi:hypothetical protein
MSFGRLIAPDGTVMPTDTSRHVKFCAISEDSTALSCSKMYAHVWRKMLFKLLSRAVNFWSSCNLCGFRRRLFWRIPWAVICSIYNSAVAREIDFFGLRTKACLTRPTSSSDLLGRPVECHFSTLPVSLNYSYYLLMLLSSGGLTPYSRLNSRWTRIMDSNFAYHNTICAFCHTVDIVMMTYNT